MTAKSRDIIRETAENKISKSSLKSRAVSKTLIWLFLYENKDLKQKQMHSRNFYLRKANVPSCNLSLIR